MTLSKGIIVGLNAKIEYLLPFFYINLRLHTDLPITFFDFGMSMLGREFCQKRGEVIAIEDSLYQNNSELTGQKIKQAWFKKPLACLLAPYEKNLWLDLDCLVKGSVSEIFDVLNDHIDMTMIREYDIHIEEFKAAIPLIPVYNSGVLCFKKNTTYIQKWIQDCHKYDLEVCGDQEILSFSIFDAPQKFKELEPRFNYFVKSQKQNNHDISELADISILETLAHHNLTPSSAHIIHFAAQMKNQLLARFVTFEALFERKVLDQDSCIL